MGRATLGDMVSTEVSTDAAGSCDVLGLVWAGEAKTNRSRSVLGLLGWWPVVARPLRVTLVSCIFSIQLIPWRCAGCRMEARGFFVGHGG